MAVTTTGNIPSLYPGEYWKFTVTITKNDSAPDISGDVVTCTMKDAESDADASALLQFDADVATSGASGIAIFTRTPAQTAGLTAGKKKVDVWWYPTDDEDRAIIVEVVHVKTRISDTP